MSGKNIKLETGTVYKKTADGVYFFRYQLNGQRKAISLKTKKQEDAIAQAKEIVPIVKASTSEIISAHVKYARGLANMMKILPLADAWDAYSRHPDRATPSTVHEQNSYKSTFEEFVQCAGNDKTGINEITPEIADKFAQYLRGTAIAVDTHNRKIKRLRKIFGDGCITVSVTKNAPAVLIFKHCN